VNDRVALLASRIAAIQRGFSAHEIRAALELLENKGSSSKVLAYLLRDDKIATQKPRARSRKRKTIEHERSKAVLDLEHKDPEKYRVLSEFDALLRKGSVLSEVIELKRLGKSLSKDFSTKSSRREAISKLMKVLSKKALPEIQQVVANVLSTHQDTDRDSDYYKLAQFIITGKSPTSQDEQRL
jgi:hypothetical protein